MVTAYAQPQGWAKLDRQQRLFEHSMANSGVNDDIAPLVDLCRQRYREVTWAIQERFLSHVQKEGGPPEGMLRQTQVFDRYLAPFLQERGKVAFFLADSLRSEMGCDLAEALSKIGAVEVAAAVSVLPAPASHGLTALMPNADGTFKLIGLEGDFFPALGTRVPKGSDECLRLPKECYGDRFLDLILEDLLARPIDRFRSGLASVDPLVIRTQDPDQIAAAVTRPPSGDDGWAYRAATAWTTWPSAPASARRLLPLGLLPAPALDPPPGGAHAPWLDASCRGGGWHAPSSPNRPGASRLGLGPAWHRPPLSAAGVAPRSGIQPREDGRAACTGLAQKAWR
jgi:hypothetical protein